VRQFTYWNESSLTAVKSVHDDVTVLLCPGRVSVMVSVMVAVGCGLEMKELWRGRL
jgi:hypothetical protein